jgi:hypothetical protein
MYDIDTLEPEFPRGDLLTVLAVMMKNIDDSKPDQLKLHIDLVKELTRLLAKDSKLQDLIGKDKDIVANFKLDTLIGMKD